MKNKLLSILFIVSMVLFTISFSIALPIYFRPFYYMLIKPLNIVETLNKSTGGNFTYSDCVKAYDEVLNYCCFYTKFGAGKLLWSQEGMEHFKDCRSLFTLDTIIMLFSALILITLSILSIKGELNLYPSTLLISGIISLLLPLVLGILVSIDFNKAFVIFHKIFFPGKTNWYFDERYDQIIICMPEEFFASCAVFIGASLFIISILLIIGGSLIISKKRCNKIASK